MVSPRRTQLHVAIVGAGPRGTSVLERLCASAQEILPSGAELTVHVIDEFAPGAGRVWRTTQPSQLLMNTVTSQVTLFTDDSVDCSGPTRPGPTLHDWTTEAEPGIGPDDYPSRAQYGRYLEWVFCEVVKKAPPSVNVEVHTARAIRLDDAPDGHQTLTISTDRILLDLSAVVLSQGHLPLIAAPDQQRLTTYAKEHGLRYLRPSNPADTDLTTIAPGERVLLRGLGLNFFDYMALLTIGRGGRFSDASNGDGAGAGLRYHPSGNEPRLYASSRRGIPYQARGDNTKGPFGRHAPLILTQDVITSFRRRAASGNAPDFLSEIWPLVAKEVETVYYGCILEAASATESCRQDFQARFLASPHNGPKEQQVLDEVGISESDRWSWHRITYPYGERVFTDTETWRQWLLDYLREDVKQAALGNASGPLKAALDVLRDLRNELRLIVDHDGLSGISYQNHLDRWYTPLNAFLSIGPPRQRIEQMIALMEADILHVLGPRLEVGARDGRFIAHSPDIPDSTVDATTLLEARLPDINLRHTADDLLSHLLKTGQCRPHTVDGYETGGLDVTENPYRLLDCQGRAHARRFAVGVPTEGVHWVTAAGARPGVNSVTLTDTDAIARAALDVAATDEQSAGPQMTEKSSEPTVKVATTETEEATKPSTKVKSWWPLVKRATTETTATELPLNPKSLFPIV